MNGIMCGLPLGMNTNNVKSKKLLLRKHWDNGSSLEMSLKFQRVKFSLIYDFYSMVKSLSAALHIFKCVLAVQKQ